MGWEDQALEALEGANLRRHLSPLEPISAVHAQVMGRRVCLFSTNDYLGLSCHPSVKAAAAEVALEAGMGPRGSALVCGHTQMHADLEKDLATLKGCEDALVFPTGYAANIGLLSAIGDAETEFFSDRLNHASIIDGCRLSRARVTIYHHLDIDDLRCRLEASQAKRKIIVTDALFSMDGTLAPLRELAALKGRYGAELIVDSAHATLTYGNRGGGLAEELGVCEEVDYSVGTLSKAIGALGGFVATSSTRKAWLLNSARAYVFSTALPLPVVAAARAALRAAASDPQLRASLWTRAEQLCKGVGQRVLSPIVPILVGDERRALSLSARLLAAGYHVPAIRPPTVPKGTARLRITMSGAHTSEDVGGLLRALREHGAI